MHLAVTLALCVIVSYLFSLLARRLRISSVVGLIVAGIIIGSSAVSELILEPNTIAVSYLGEIGLVSLMFIAGMEISWRNFCREERNAAVISVSAMMVPFLIGFAVFLSLGFSILTSLTAGICMSITAEATSARVLMEIRKLKTKIGSLMMGAGIIDDIMGIFLFVVVSYIFTRSLETSEILLLIVSMVSFFAGIATHRFIGRERHVIPYIERGILLFIVPFFFISMGIHFSLQSLTLNPLLLVVIIAVAISAKIIGVFVTKPLTGLSIKQLYLVGWGMNSRGAVGLAIAFVGFRIGLLDTGLYSGLVFMALFTTIVFPFFIRSMVRNNPHVMG